MRTRSKASSATEASKDADEAVAAISTKTVAPSVDNPHKLFILPKDASSDARIVTLSNPATGSANRYYFCPEKGFYEFTRIAAPKKTPRSWLLSSRSVQRDGHQTSGEQKSPEKPAERNETSDMPTQAPQSYITKDASLFVVTPIDALFLVLPALHPSTTKAGTKQMFLSVDDYFDVLSASSPHMRQLLRNATTRALLERRMAAICDTVDAGDEKMYRLSIEKLAAELLAKARRMVANGLPASMEDKFIRAALEVPVMAVKREDSDVSIAAATEAENSVPIAEDMEEEKEKAGKDTPPTGADDQADTQPTTATTSLDPTETAIDAPPSIPQLLRLRTALSFLLTSYIPSHLHPILSPSSSSSPSPTPYPLTFHPLTTHLTHLATLRARAHALRALSDNISRKRAGAGGNDDEQADRHAEKRRRKEEEEKRKKMQSRAVRELKKVDTTGMRKLSCFFGKKA